MLYYKTQCNRLRATYVFVDTYFALNASCLSLGQTHASLDVLDPPLPVRRGLEFVLDGVATVPDTFFCTIPEEFVPVNLHLYEDPLVGLVAALRVLLEANELLSTALYILSTDER